MGDTLLVREVLYFGRNRSNAEPVSDDEWRAFLNQVITARFPSGLTAVSGSGQWRGANGVLEQERSEIVTIFHSGDEPARQALQEITAEYKRRFRQEAVLREHVPTCGHFD
jgi:hypothetical protein